MNKKRNVKESMICFTPKPGQKILGIIRVSFGPPSSPDLNPFDYTICIVLESKTNASSHPNISSFKTAIEDEWNKMFKEFILKVWFLCLMAYQPAWVISCKSHSCIRTVVIQFNPYLGGKKGLTRFSRVFV